MQPAAQPRPSPGAACRAPGPCPAKTRAACPPHPSAAGWAAQPAAPAARDPPLQKVCNNGVAWQDGWSKFCGGPVSCTCSVLRAPGLSSECCQTSCVCDSMPGWLTRTCQAVLLQQVWRSIQPLARWGGHLHTTAVPGRGGVTLVHIVCALECGATVCTLAGNGLGKAMPGRGCRRPATELRSSAARTKRSTSHSLLAGSCPDLSFWGTQSPGTESAPACPSPGHCRQGDHTGMRGRAVVKVTESWARQAPNG